MIIRAVLTAVQSTDLPILTKNFLTFCSADPSIPDHRPGHREIWRPGRVAGAMLRFEAAFRLLLHLDKRDLVAPAGPPSFQDA